MLKYWKFLFLILLTVAPAYSQVPAGSPLQAAPLSTPEGNSESQTAERRSTGSSEPAGQPAAQGDAQPELEYDDRISVKVTPLSTGPVVDRVMEPATVIVRAPGAAGVEVYLEPVDAPYGGRSKGEPRLLGKTASYNHTRGFSLAWNSGEPYRYVRLFAIAVNSSGQMVRSRGTDLAMGGVRQLPELVPEKTPAQK